MKKAILFALPLAVLLNSCGPKRLPFGEFRDRDLTIQYMEIGNDQTDTTYLSYKARIIPGKASLEEMKQAEKNALFYRMDSCFSLLKGGKIIAASLVQPVASGVPGTFEFLLEFEKSTGVRGRRPVLIYRDKYLSRKTYQIQLND